MELRAEDATLNVKAEELPEDLTERLQATAKALRYDIVRMIGLAGSGHPGGSLSCADIVTALYFYKLRHRPEDPDWPERDRFVMSKGHGAPTLYAALARCGYFDREELWNLRRLGCMLQGHPDIKTPGVDICSGSLGQGLATACGMALAARLDGLDYRVYALLGDGETQEGEVWESAMFAAHHRLRNLVAFIDNNGLQIDGWCCDIMDFEPLADKWRAFGWKVAEIDGHDMEAICRALDSTDPLEGPYMFVARTTKGKGVSFMENVADFHGKAPSPEQMEAALKEIEGS
ncbi:MAG: transketolase [Candidatus Geothermincolia bacterium]